MQSKNSIKLIYTSEIRVIIIAWQLELMDLLFEEVHKNINGNWISHNKLWLITCLVCSVLKVSLIPITICRKCAHNNELNCYNMTSRPYKMNDNINIFYKIISMIKALTWILIFSLSVRTLI